MILDLHTHTRRSHDGFTEIKELIDACKIRGVDAIAVTEHDHICEFDSALFKSAGIELIPGCEYTDHFGAHILGLFVQQSLPFGQSTENILSHIRAEGGFSVMPHPWKPGSGFMALNGSLTLVAQFDFIELINGGWRSRERAVDIVRLASDFGLRMIASSDSHKACHVGLCCTRIVTNESSLDVQELLMRAKQEEMELLIDKMLLEKIGRRTNAVQRSPVYQKFLPTVPKHVRRAVKLLRYRYSSDRFSRPGNLTKVDVCASPW